MWQPLEEASLRNVPRQKEPGQLPCRGPGRESGGSAENGDIPDRVKGQFLRRQVRASNLGKEDVLGQWWSNAPRAAVVPASGFKEGIKKEENKTTKEGSWT